VRYGADCWPLFTKALTCIAEDVKGLSIYSLGYLSPPTNWLETAIPVVSKWPARFELNQGGQQSGGQQRGPQR